VCVCGVCGSVVCLSVCVCDVSLFVFKRLNRRGKASVNNALVTFPNLLILTVQFVYQHTMKPLFQLAIIVLPLPVGSLIVRVLT